MNHLNENQLNEYLDQMLDDASRQQAETHLASCKQCRAELADLEMLFSSLAELPEIPLKHDLKAGVLARLPREMQIPVLWRQPAFVMQSLLTIILLAIGIPIFETFRQRIPTMPTITLPSYSGIAAEFVNLLAWQFEFTFTMPEFTFTIPTMPTLPHLPISLEPSIMLVLLLVATTLWGIGNFSLLRSKPEVRG
ncbi:MAG: hypothetical protein HN390_16800 [Anaerolineae bacterium]|jgi:hypothetical protein|nr:hypothetical protein [Anaerolineae bacterium]MBT7191989.1 hypothetical protein [Anaerolineae bacterium]MBT7992169.1 hypothetical protein [Anaerolineae bacterium]